MAEREDRDSRAHLATILHTSAEALRIVAALVHPVIPEATARIWIQLGVGDIRKFDLRSLAWGQIQAGTMLSKVEPVFPRADKSIIERMQQMEQQRSEAAASAGSGQAPSPTEGEKSGAPDETKAAATQIEPAVAGAKAGQPGTPRATPAAAPLAGGPSSAPGAPSSSPAAGDQAAATTDNRISIDDFFKVDLRVGLVKVAEKVKGADKLLRLEVDIGTEVRQVVAGIAKAYEPEKLVGRKVVIVANIPPRKLRGLESNGMIVAASVEDGLPVLASFLEDVPIGARLK